MTLFPASFTSNPVTTRPSAERRSVADVAAVDIAIRIENRQQQRGRRLVGQGREIGSDLKSNSVKLMAHGTPLLVHVAAALLVASQRDNRLPRRNQLLAIRVRRTGQQSFGPLTHGCVLVSQQSLPPRRVKIPRFHRARLDRGQ